MNPDLIKRLFPRASKSTIEANSYDGNPDTRLRSQKPESTPRNALGGAPPGKTKSDARIGVSYVMRRIRLLDTDNAYGATKTLTDCLCEVGLLPGDSDKDITINVRQEKVNHRSEECTEIVLEYL